MEKKTTQRRRQGGSIIELMEEEQKGRKLQYRRKAERWRCNKKER